MSRFRYTAVAADGTKVKDEVDAMSEAFARDELLARNLEVQTIKPGAPEALVDRSSPSSASSAPRS